LDLLPPGDGGVRVDLDAEPRAVAVGKAEARAAAAALDGRELCGYAVRVAPVEGAPPPADPATLYWSPAARAEVESRERRGRGRGTLATGAGEAAGDEGETTSRGHRASPSFSGWWMGTWWKERVVHPETAIPPDLSQLPLRLSPAGYLHLRQRDARDVPALGYV
jgi:hypothetical protein